MKQERPVAKAQQQARIAAERGRSEGMYPNALSTGPEHVRLEGLRRHRDPPQPGARQGRRLQKERDRHCVTSS